jgi:hypothetical protein
MLTNSRIVHGRPPTKLEEMQEMTTIIVFFH